LSHTTTYIKQVQDKVQHLLKRYGLLQKENESLHKKVEALQKEKINFEARVEQLKQQYLIVKASASPLSGKEKKEMEQKINQYLQNIDKCISLLGK